MFGIKPPAFRADHVGSLVRPALVIDARTAFEAGKIDATKLRAVEDEAIRAVVAKQESVGLEVATDGEFCRGTYSDSFTTRGISGSASSLLRKKGGTNPKAMCESASNWGPQLNPNQRLERA